MKQHVTCQLWTAVLILCPFSLLYAQTDTLSRSVTVEREYQPIIQSAGKLNVSPQRLEIQEPTTEVVYSDYSAADSSSFNAKPMRFASKPFPTPEQTTGLLEGSAGYIGTYLNFRYRVPVKGKASKGVQLDLYAMHNANWGIKTFAESQVGMDFVKQFSSLDVYFNVSGKNTFFTRYGRYFDGSSLTIDRYKDFVSADKQNIWEVNTMVGVRSKKNADIYYDVHTGYRAYVLPSQVAEHQIRTAGNVEWNGDEHRAGADLTILNAFYSVEDGLWQPLDTIREYNSRHAIRIHPYYKYVGERVRVRVGINLDLNIGKGQMISSNQDISFAPSPDVFAEYRIIPSWLAVYAGATGQFGEGTLAGHMEYCPYRSVSRGVISQHVCGYIPIDAFLGFKIRATDNLLLDVYAHYAYMKNQVIMYADSLFLQQGGFLDYTYGDYQRWKVGVELTYHYQDIIRLLVSGNYYHWTTQSIEDSDRYGMSTKTLYDRPQWDAHLRVEAHINSHWSLYSDNHLDGAVNLMTYKGIEKVHVDAHLNLGARYDMNDKLGFYLQLNNLLNCNHFIFYGYQAQGINGRIGVSWKF